MPTAPAERRYSAAMVRNFMRDTNLARDQLRSAERSRKPRPRVATSELACAVRATPWHNRTSSGGTYTRGLPNHG